MNRTLGHADEVARLIRRDGKLQGTRIGKSHILARKTHDAPRDVQGIFTRFQHAREPVNRSVGIGISHRLVERRNQIVMLLALLVVEQRLLLQALLHRFARDTDRTILHIAVQHDDLQGRKSHTCITVSEHRERFQKIIGNLHLLIAKTLRRSERTVQKPQDVLLLQCPEHKDAAA